MWLSTCWILRHICALPVDCFSRDGRLVVQVPDRDCWEAALLGDNWTGLDVPRHIHVFRSSDLRRLLRSCGFEIVREKHFSLRDHPAGLATGLAPSIDPVVRAIRGIDGVAAVRILKDFLYLGLTTAALPFTLLEALFGKGSSVTIEVRAERIGTAFRLPRAAVK